jgi:hypothetical protein
LLARDRPDTQIILVNVQSRETLEVSDIAAVISADPDRETAAYQAKKALRRAIGLRRKAEVKFEARPIAQTRIARQLNADQIPSAVIVDINLQLPRTQADLYRHPGCP